MSTGVKTAVGRFVWHEHASGSKEEAKRFYTELLGWDVEVWKPGEADYEMISSGGSQHGAFTEAQGGAPPHWLGHIVVEDARKTAEQAQQAGGSVLTGPMDMPEVGSFAIVRDPQGAVFSAYQPAGDAPVSEGVFVWDELLTNDADGAKRFYGELFGWTSQDQDMGDDTYTLFSVGDTQIAGSIVRDDTPPHWYPYVAVDDVDASTEKAKQLGATVYVEPTDIPDMGRFSVLGDPTGATVGLFKGTAS